MLSSEKSGTTNQLPVSVTATFSEPVREFLAGDITVTNCATLNLRIGGNHSYIFEVIPISSLAPMTVKIKAGLTLDRAGNPNLASSTLRITYDASPPVVRSLVAQSPTKESPIAVRGVWSKPIRSFASDQIAVKNAQLIGFEKISDTEFRIELQPLESSCLVQVEIPEKSVEDQAGNFNRASPKLTVIYDTLAPLAALSTSASSPVASSPIVFKVSFGEPVLGFQLNDVVVDGGSTHGLRTLSTSEFEFSVIPRSSSSDIRIYIVDGAAVDFVGLPSIGSEVMTLFYDADIPYVQLSSPIANPGAELPITISATFSKEVIGFSESDLIVSGGSVARFRQVSASNYDFIIVPSSSTAMVTVDISDGAAQDLNGNSNIKASTFILVHDSVPPTVTLAQSDDGTFPTSKAPISCVATFSEGVLSFREGDIRLSGAGKLRNFARVSDAVYSFDIVPLTTSATISLSIEGGAVKDYAGNANIASSPFSFVYDASSPVVELKTVIKSPSKAHIFPVVLEWTEPVSQISEDDVTIEGGSLQNFVLVTSSTYTFDVRPSFIDGDVRIFIRGGIATDSAGNPNLAAVPLILRHDSAMPVVEKIGPLNGPPYSSSPILYTLVFSEPVIGFGRDDLWIKDGVLGSFDPDGPTSYRFTIVPSSSTALVTVSIDSGVCTDLAGNPNSPSEVVKVEFDSTAPSIVSFGSPLGTSTSESPFPVRVKFSKPVRRLSVSSLTLSAGSVESVRTLSTQEYEFLVISPKEEGTLALLIAAGATTDFSGQPNEASPVVTILSDSIPPIIEVLQTDFEGSVTNSYPILAKVRFSEPVSGFSLSDITVANSTLADMQITSPTEYSFKIYPLATHITVSLQILENSVFDAAGNSNLIASAQTTFEYDSQAPVVTLSVPSLVSSKRFQNPVPVTVSFSKPVYGFDDRLADVKMFNSIAGAIKPLDSSGMHYEVFAAPWPPSAEITISVDIPAGVCHDVAGNANLAATEALIISHDSLEPQVISISTTASQPTNQSPVPITVRFSEPVKGFSSAAISVTGANINTLAASSDYLTEFSFEVMPVTDVATIEISIAGNSVSDRAGNTNRRSKSRVFFYDAEKPTALLVTSSNQPITLLPFPVTAIFSEAIQNIPESALRVKGGVASNIVAKSPKEYVFEIAPQGNTPDTGSVQVAIRRMAVMDLAGNLNLGSEELSILFTLPQTAPPHLVTLSTPVSNPVRDPSIQIFVEWNLPVSGFQIGDIIVTGAHAHDWQRESSTRYNFIVTPFAEEQEITVQVPEDAASYGGVFNKFRSNKLSIKYDSVAPTVELTTSVSTSSPTNKLPVPFTATFSEPVNNFNVDSLVVDGGSATNVSVVPDSKNTVFTFDITPSSFSVTVAVYVDKNVASDLAGNLNIEPSDLIILQHDSISPSVFLESDVIEGITKETGFSVAVEFSKPVKEFSKDKLFISGGIITSFTPQSQSLYFVDVEALHSASMVELKVFPGVARDFAGNENVASSVLKLLSDSKPPSIVALHAVDTVPGTVPIPVQIVFDKIVDLSAKQLKVKGGSISSVVAQSNFSYAADLVPDSNSVSMLIEIPAGAISDTASNTNEKGAILEIFDDLLPPTVTSISSELSLPTSQPEIPITIKFSEEIGPISTSVFVVEGGSLINLQRGTSKRIYTAKLRPLSSSVTMKVSIPAGAIKDTSGAFNSASDVYTFTYDSEPPRIREFVAAGSNPTARSVIPISIKWTEDVEGFSKEHVLVTGGTITSFSRRRGSFYSAEVVPDPIVSPASWSLVILKIAGRQVQDSAGNWNMESLPLEIEYEPNAPSVVLSTNTTGPSSSSPIFVTAAFTSPVVGFDRGSIVCSGARVVSFEAVSKVLYEFLVEPLTSTTIITLDIHGGACNNLAGTSNSPAEQLRLLHDADPPVVQSLFSQRGTPTNGNPISVTVMFNEDVSDFTQADIVVEGGVLQRQSFVSTSGSRYTFNVIPKGDSASVVVFIPPGAALDAAGNANFESDRLVVLYDSRPPEISLLEMTGSSQRSPVPFTVHWNKEITGFSSSDLIVSGGVITRLVKINVIGSSMSQYVFDLLPLGTKKDFTIQVAANAVQDLAGNFNDRSTVYTFSHDSEPLMVRSLESLGENPGTVAPVAVGVMFSKPVEGISLSAFAVDGGTAANLVTRSPESYTFDIIPSSEEITMEISVTSGQVRDYSGNGNVASDILRLRYDTLPPEVRIVTDITGPTKQVPILATAVFSEAVQFFGPESVMAQGASITKVITMSDTSYAIELVPEISTGNVEISIPQGVVKDFTNHVNVASETLTVKFDSDVPMVKSLTTLSAVTVSSPVLVTAVFTEPVYGFNASAFRVSGAQIANFRKVDTKGTTFVVDLLPEADTVHICVMIDGNSAVDEAGNRNIESTPLSILYDTELPVVQSIVSSSHSPSKESPFHIFVNWTEPVVDFTVGDVAVSGGAAINFVAISKESYEFDLVPVSSVVTVQVGILGGKVHDVAGNPNVASEQLSLVHDVDPPTVLSLRTTAPDPVSRSPIPITATFSEPVVAFEVSSISIEGGTCGNLFGVSTTIFTWDITPASNSIRINVSIAANVVTDLAGNGNTLSTPLSIMYDSVLPLVQLLTPVSTPISNPLVPVTALFSDPVSRFSAEAITVSGGRAQDFVAHSDVKYTFNVLPMIPYGNVTVLIEEGGAVDAAGNENAASALLTLMYDSRHPSVTLLSNASSPGRFTPIPIRAVFDKAVVDFNVDSITVKGGTANNFVEISESEFAFDVTPAAASINVTIGIEEGSTADSAGNTNSASNELTFVHDSIRPGVTQLSTTIVSPTNENKLPFMVRFSEAVVDFTPAAVSVTGGKVVNLVALSSVLYTFDVLPSSSFEQIKVEIKGGVVSDEAGNVNTPSRQPIHILYDGSPPTIKSIRSDVGSLTAVSPIPITIEWSELVSGFELADLLVMGGVARKLVTVSQDIYTFTIMPVSNSVNITVNVKENAVQDAVGNTNPATTASEALVVAHDSDALVIRQLKTSLSLPTAQDVIPVTAVFSEQVTGFELGDVVIVNATGANFRSVSAFEYTFDVIPSRTKTSISVDIPAGVASDSAGNTNKASFTLAMVHDSEPPYIERLVTSARSPSAIFPIPVTVEFSEPVSSFGLENVEIRNGTGTGGFFSLPTEFVFQVIPSGATTTVIISIPEGAVRDNAANTNLQRAQLVVEHDSIPPTIRLSSEESSNPSALASYPVTAIFSERLLGFTTTDIQVVGGTIENLLIGEPSSSNYSFSSTFDVVPLSASEKITLTVPSGAVRDLAGNPNVASNALEFIHDSTPLQVTELKPLVRTPTNIAPVQLKIRFSDDVHDFGLEDIVITNGEITYFLPDPIDSKEYMFYASPISDTVNMTVHIPANVATDWAGNRNMESEQLTVLYDVVAPVVISLQTGAGEIMNLRPIPFTAEFSEPVFDFDANEIVVNGGYVADVKSKSQNIYIFEVIPNSSEGTISVFIKDGVAFDAAQNPNRHGESELEISYDYQPPKAVLMAASVDLSGAIKTSPIPVTCIFSEVVADFEARSVEVSGGALSNFVPVSTTQYTFDVEPLFDAVTIEVRIPDDAAQDKAGNGNVASQSLFIRYDQEAPTAVIVPEATRGQPIKVGVYFNENVLNFTIDDLTVQGAGVTDFREESPSRYIYYLQPESSTSQVQVSIAEAVVHDQAALANQASGPVTIITGRQYFECGGYEDATIELTEETIKQYKHCSVISGNITVHPSIPTRKFNLPNLRFIDGDLTISNHPSLVDMQALRNLTGVSGRMFISNNPQLKSLKGMDHVKKVGGLFISRCISLEHLDSLRSLDIVEHDFTIEQCPMLRSVAGLCLLSSVGGPVRVSESSALCCGALQSVFAKVQISEHFDLYESSCQSECTEGENDFYCDVCRDSHCLHGTCESLKGRFTCICEPGWSGDVCSEDVSLGLCSLSPCQNGGICEPTGTEAYTCHCQPGFVGVDCQLRFFSLEVDNPTVEVSADTFIHRYQTQHHGVIDNVDSPVLKVGKDDSAFLRFSLPSKSFWGKDAEFSRALLHLSLAGNTRSTQKTRHALRVLMDVDWRASDISWEKRPPQLPIQPDLEWVIADNSNDFITVDVSSYVLPILDSSGQVSFQISRVGGSMEEVEYYSSEALDDSLIPRLLLTRFDPNEIPKLTAVRFSDRSPSLIFVDFDIPTNRGGQRVLDTLEKCATLFAEPIGSMFSECLWLSDRRLSIRVFPDMPSAPDVLTFRASDLRNKHGTSLPVFQKDTTVEIQSPLWPAKPLVSLIGPSEVSSCADFVLDATASLNTLNREATYAWLMNGAPVPYSGRNSNILKVGAGTLSSGQTYIFTLEITNVYGAVGSAQHTVTVRSSALPSVSLPTTSTVLASHDFRLQPVFDWNGCASPLAAVAGFRFMWSCKDTVDGKGISLSSPSSRELNVQKGTLQAGREYVIGLIVWSNDEIIKPFRVEVSAVIRVLESSLVAFIEGGHRTVYAHQTTILDASGSFDPDDPLGVHKGSWSFFWSCKRLDPVGHVKGDFCHPSSTGNGPLLSVSSLAPGSDYRFSVSFTDSSRSSRHSFASVVIHVAESKKPQTLMFIEAPRRSNSNDWLHISAFALSSRQTPPTEMRYRWLVDNASALSLESTAAHLAIPPGTLEPGRWYQFTAEGSEPGKPALAGIASAMVYVNEPPNGGSLVISPVTGEAFSTWFTLDCRHWFASQDNSQLWYTFRYARESSSTGNEIVLSDRLTIPTLRTLLPAGTIRIIVEVSDENGAIGRVESNVNVILSSNRTSFLCHMYDFANSQLASARSQNNFEFSLAVVSSVAEGLNIDCIDEGSEQHKCVVVGSSIEQVRNKVRHEIYSTLSDIVFNVKMTPLRTEQVARAMSTLSLHQDISRCPVHARGLDFRQEKDQYFDSMLPLLERLISAENTEETNLLVLHTMSNLLGPTSRKCSRLDSLRKLVKTLNAHYSHVPVAMQTILKSNNIQHRVERIYFGREVSVNVPGVDILVRFSPEGVELRKQTTTRAAVVVDQFPPFVKECRDPGTLVSSITEVSATFQDQHLQLEHPPVELQFHTSLPSACINQAQPQCVQWNSTASAWTHSTCATLEVIPTGGGLLVRCECSALGEFAVKNARPAPTLCAFVAIGPASGYMTFTVAYGVLGLLTVAHLFRTFSAYAAKASMIVRHATITCICICQMMLTLHLSGMLYLLEPSAQTNTMLTATSITMLGWILSLTAAEWLAIYYNTMGRPGKNSIGHHFKILVVVVNVVALGLLCAVFLAPAETGNIGTCGLALTGLAVSTVFIASAPRALKALNNGKGESAIGVKKVIKKLAAIMLCAFVCLAVQLSSLLLALEAEGSLLGASFWMTGYLVAEFLSLSCLLLSMYVIVSRDSQQKEGEEAYSFKDGTPFVQGAGSCDKSNANPKRGNTISEAIQKKRSYKFDKSNSVSSLSLDEIEDLSFTSNLGPKGTTNGSLPHVEMIKLNDSIR